MINWTNQKDVMELESQIAKRAVAMANVNGIKYGLMDALMDIDACHSNGNPLKLHELLGADDFYNGNNQYGVKECWNLKTAKLVKRFKIYWWTPMDKASYFTEVKVLSCYHDLKNGRGNAYLTDIPAHLKQEWKELARK